MFRRIWLGSLLIGAGLFAACGNGDGAEPVAPADRASDEAYLAVICTGVERYSSALFRATGPEEIISVIEEYIDSLEQAEPPADAVSFHESFIAYLTESLDEPTQLVNRRPPLPDDDVRERLAEVEGDVEECQDLVFFAERQEDLTR